MRKFIDIIKESDTKLKDKPSILIDLEPELSKGELAPTSPNQSRAPAMTDLPGKKASAAKTRASVRAPADMARAASHISSLNSMGIDDEISDADAMRNAGHDANTTDGVETPPTPQNLPAVMSKAIADTGGGLEPEWHMVKQLPGYIQNGIRAMGRAVFRQFTDTPIEEIQVLSTLSNDESEVRAMMAWIKHNGVRDDRADMDFAASMPGYQADVQLWNSKGFSFLLVKDFAGYYVYGWPGGRGVHVGAENRPRLR